MKLTLFVPQICEPPIWAGMIYKDYMRDGAVYTLMPFNKLARGFRAFIYWVKYPEKSTIEEKMTRLETHNNELSRENIKLQDKLNAVRELAIEIKNDIAELAPSERKVT